VPELPDLSRAKALEPLVDWLAELKSPARVAIDGPDAAGKTTLGQELATLIAEQGRTADRISADDFLRPPADRYRRGRESPEGYYADSFDHAALRAAVRRARAVVLVDGIFLMRPELDDLWSFRVYVAVAVEESLGRGIKRDGAEAERFYRARYLPGQRLYDSQARPRERADVVVENDDVELPRLVWREGVLPPGA
jgi:uridine kinase